MEEKILLSIAGALSPILFSFIFKKLESRNANTLRTRTLDEVQKQLELVKNYYEVQSVLLEGEKLAELKKELSTEAALIRDRLLLQPDQDKVTEKGKLSPFSRIFLTFKPHTAWGWILHLACYLDAIFMFFVGIGFFVDEQGNFSQKGLINNLQNTDLLIGTALFFLILLLLRWLALRNYDKANKKINSKA
jgi:hypothetical protein